MSLVAGKLLRLMEEQRLGGWVEEGQGVPLGCGKGGWGKHREEGGGRRREEGGGRREERGGREEGGEGLRQGGDGRGDFLLCSFVVCGIRVGSGPGGRRRERERGGAYKQTGSMKRAGFHHRVKRVRDKCQSPVDKLGPRPFHGLQ
ncbi:hypothetical protein EYF80_060693 [Liparis tanakae]|uniref:Uncharacterized protein n=1 Tax=Liparis tanakae TaxID=230148 RepID=A0A4Z2EK20_9TELE|nr:hypothetical protein EYF80_060693 [Liparis tanakae]